MLSQSLRQGFLVLSLLALGLTPTAAQARTHAAGKPVVAAAPAQGSLVQTLWRGIVHLFQKEGAGIDPSGKPTTTSSLAGTGDEGAGIDPSGLHH